MLNCYCLAATKALQPGSNVDARDCNGKTVLHLASEDGNLSLVDELLQANTNINAQTIYSGRTALHLAAANNYLNTVKLLIKKGANACTTDNNNCTALHLAAYHGNLEIVHLLLDKKMNIEAETDKNRTTLHMAVENGHLKVVTLLLKKGANAKAVDQKKFTSLHIAAAKGFVTIAMVLLKHGADVNAQLDTKATPLFLAAAYNRTEVVCTLLQHGAKYEITTIGDSIMGLSKSTETVEIITFIHMIGRFFDEIKKGNYRIVQELNRIRNKDVNIYLACINARNCQGQTLIQVALINKHKDIAGALTHTLRETKLQKSGTDKDDITGLMSSCTISTPH